MASLQQQVPALTASVGDVVGQMRASLEAVLRMMHGFGNVEQQYVAETEALMGTLVEGVDKIAHLAKTRADSRLGSGTGTVRARAHSEPAAEVPDKRIRLPAFSLPVPGFRIDPPDYGPTPSGSPRQRAADAEMDGMETPVPDATR